MSEVSADIPNVTAESNTGNEGKESPLALKKLGKNRYIRAALLTVGIARLLRVVSPLALGVFGLASAGEHNNMGQGWKS